MTIRNDSTRHTEEELWRQAFALSRELQDCKAGLHRDRPLDVLSAKIEGLEKELDVLLEILRNADDKKTL